VVNKNLIYRVRRSQRERGPNFIAKRVELTFGSIVVEGKKYRRDILIFADDTVKRHKAGPGERF